MKKTEILDIELFQATSLIISLTDPEQFEKNFPTLSNYIKLFHGEVKEIQDQIIEEAQKELKSSEIVSIKKNDLLDLYAYASASIGFENMQKDYPGLRLLILNLMDQKGLDNLLNKIRSFEEQLFLKFN